MHSSMYQRPPMSEPVPLYLSIFYSPLVLSVEYHKLEFLGTTHCPPLETTEYNEKQYIKDYSGLFAQAVLLFP